MADDKISINEMRDQAGRLLFGDDWIGGLTDDEHELMRNAFVAQEVHRADGSRVVLDHAKRLPIQTAPIVDRALGRAWRLQAQYVAVDTWLQEHEMFRSVEVVEVDGKRSRKTFRGERKAFCDLIASEAAKQAPAEPEARRGPKAEILPRVKAAMEADLRETKITRERLADMPDKELEGRYQAKRERVTAARAAVLAELPTNNTDKAELPTK
jgi:hypothetical protein